MKKVICLIFALLMLGAPLTASAKAYDPHPSAISENAEFENWTVDNECTVNEDVTVTVKGTLDITHGLLIINGTLTGENVEGKTEMDCLELGENGYFNVLFTKGSAAQKFKYILNRGGASVTLEGNRVIAYGNPNAGGSVLSDGNVWILCGAAAAAVVAAAVLITVRKRKKQ